MGGFLLGIVGNLVASALVTLPALAWHHRSMVRHVRRATGTQNGQGVKP